MQSPTQFMSAALDVFLRCDCNPADDVDSSEKSSCVTGGAIDATLAAH